MRTDHHSAPIQVGLAEVYMVKGHLNVPGPQFVTFSDILLSLHRGKGIEALRMGSLTVDKAIANLYRVGDECCKRTTC